jgi:hypothetical protein
MPARARGSGELFRGRRNGKAVARPGGLARDLALALEREHDREAPRRLDGLVCPEEGARLVRKAADRRLRA